MASGQQQTERPLIHAPELAGAGGWINTAEPLSLAKLRGKVVLLDFWTFCCINCLHIIEELRPLEAAFPNDLVVIGVHSPKFPEESDHEAVERAVARHRIMHPVLDDPDMVTWRRYGIRAWPSLVLIDARGYVRWAGSGEGYGQALFGPVRQLIDEAKGLDSYRPGPAFVATGSNALSRLNPARSTLAYPGKVTSNGADRLAIADTGHDRVLITSLDGRILSEYTGFNQPQGVLFDFDRLLVCDTVADQVVAIDLASGARRVIAEGISSPWDIAPYEGGFAVAEAGRHRLWYLDGEGGAEVLAGTSGENIVDGPALEALLAQPSGLSTGPDGALYIADSEVSALRRLQDGMLETLVGEGLFVWGTEDGDKSTARLQHPLGVAAAPDGAVYVADTFNSRLRVWRDGLLTTLPITSLTEPAPATQSAGDTFASPATQNAVPAARSDAPAAPHDGSQTANGHATQAATKPVTASDAVLDEPGGLCLLPDGRLAVADTNHHRILLVDPATGAASVLPLPAPADPDHPELQILPANTQVPLTATLDLEGDDLDPRTGPPVRLSLSAEPATLLAAGPRVWALDTLPAAVTLPTGAGEGEIYIDLQAASCLGEECRLHRRRITLPVRLTPDTPTTALTL